LSQLSVILANSQNVPFVRQAAGLQLKNTLTANDEERRQIYQQRWLVLPALVKLKVKQYVLQALGTETRPSSAAHCISAIASVEIPKGVNLCG
jgi:importin subunit beta-1